MRINLYPEKKSDKKRCAYCLSYFSTARLYYDHKSRCQYASGQVWETRVDHNQRWRWNLQWNYPRLSIKSIGKPKEKTIKYKCQLCREIFGKKELKLHRCRGRIPNKTNQ